MKRTLFILLFSLNTYFVFSGLFQINGYNFIQLSHNTVTFLSCDSTYIEKNHITSIKIPSEITYLDTCYKVVAFGNIMVKDKFPTVTDISIPASVIQLSIYAYSNVFDSYPNLKTITVSSNNQRLKSINGVLFDKKGEVLIKYPSAANESSYLIPTSVKFIESNAFYNCKKLENINIPNSIKEIDENNFEACSMLQIITVDNDNLKYKSIDGVLFNKNTTKLLKYPDGKNATSYKIPVSVKIIGRNAFAGNYSLNHIELFTAVDTIKGEAFNNCKGLKSITFPSSVSTIETNAFKSCTNLTSVIISSTKTHFEPEVFAYCDSLKTVVFPPDQNYIENGMFKNCTGLTNYTIPASINSIGINAFQGCKGLTELILPEKINTIKSGAFEDCTGLKKIYLPNSLITIEVGTFRGCTGITDLFIPSSIKHISAIAFKGCENLKSVIIPSSVLSIGYEAFSDCTNLIDIQYPDSHISLGQNVFSNTAYINSQPNGIIYLNHAAYMIKGKLPTQTIEFKEGTTGIADYAFFNQDNYIELKFPNTVRYIGSNAFANCRNLKRNVCLPQSLVFIGEKAFYNCSNLTNINIPITVDYIGNEAFRNCNKMKDIQIPDSLKFIGMFAFSNTEWYKSQPNGLIYIGNKLYRYKGDMPEKTSIVIRNGTTAIIGGAFSKQNNLVKIYIPASVKEIGDDSFVDCSELSSIYISSSNPIKFSNPNYIFPAIPYHMFTNSVLNTQSELLGDFIFQVYNTEKAIAHGNGIYSFKGINKDICTLYVPIGAKIKYANAESWKDFKQIVEFDASTIE